MFEPGTMIIHHTGAFYEFVCTGTMKAESEPWYPVGIYQSSDEDRRLHVFVRPMCEFSDVVTLPNGLEVQRFTDATAERKICRGCGDWTLPVCMSCKMSICENCAAVHLKTHDVPAASETPED